MAAQDATQVYRIRGRLVLNPQNLAIAYPFGGTALGFTALQMVKWNAVYEKVRAEEWGRVREIHEQQLQPTLAFLLAQLDPDFFAAVFRSTSSGTGFSRVDGGGYGSRGNLPAASALLLAPLNANAPGFLIRRPILRLEEDAETKFAGTEDASFSLVVETTPGSTGEDWQFSQLAGMTL